MDGSVFMDERVDRMEYRIIRSRDMNAEAGLARLEVEVNQALSEGWQLVGGICVADLIVFAQAVQRVRPLPSNNQTNFLNDINRMRG